jgi:hypothetical protein
MYATSVLVTRSPVALFGKARQSGLAAGGFAIRCLHLPAVAVLAGPDESVVVGLAGCSGTADADQSQDRRACQWLNQHSARHHRGKLRTSC